MLLDCTFELKEQRHSFSFDEDDGPFTVEKLADGIWIDENFQPTFEEQKMKYFIPPHKIEYVKVVEDLINLDDD